MGADTIKIESDIDIETRLQQIEQKLDVMTKSSLTFFAELGLGSRKSRHDEIDLLQLWNAILAGKWIVVAFTLVVSVVSVVYALSLPNIYKSEALLAPAEENSGGGLGGMAGQFGGLAGLAGVSFGGGSDKTALALKVLRSREFVSSFIKRHNLLVPLVAAKGWNQNEDSLMIDPDLYDVKSGMWLREAKPPRTPEPSMQEAYKVFINRLNVDQNKATNFVTVGIEHYSPKLAKTWVDMLVRDINDEIKEREVAEAKKSILYLTNQLEKTSVADMKIVFYELIEEQSKTIMFAEVRDEYVFNTIDAAIIPEVKSGPKRSIICILGVILGGMLGVFYMLVRFFFNYDNRL